MQTILKYFPRLPQGQKEQLSKLSGHYQDWNSKINVISRKDMEHIYIRHVLYSMSLLKYFSFKSGTSFLDVGTGGGFPGIPLAICLPECEFLLCDSIGKKMRVVGDIAEKLELHNVKYLTERAEKIPGTFDFILGRAVTTLPDFIKYTKDKIASDSKNAFPNGILYFKGGEFEMDLNSIKMHFRLFQLNEIIQEDFFLTKKIVHFW